MALFPPIKASNDINFLKKSDGNSRTSILANNEVDVGRKRHLQTAVAHEVLQDQFLDDADVSLALQRVGGTWSSERASDYVQVHSTYAQIHTHAYTCTHISHTLGSTFLVPVASC